MATTASFQVLTINVPPKKPLIGERKGRREREREREMQTDRLTDRRKEGWRDRQTYVHRGRQIDGQTVCVGVFQPWSICTDYAG